MTYIGLVLTGYIIMGESYCTWVDFIREVNTNSIRLINNVKILNPNPTCLLIVLHGLTRITHLLHY